MYYFWGDAQGGAEENVRFDGKAAVWPPSVSLRPTPLTRPNPSVAARHLPTLWGVTPRRGAFYALYFKELQAHPGQDLAFAAGDLDLGAAEDLGGFGLGAVIVINSSNEVCISFL